MLRPCLALLGFLLAAAPAAAEGYAAFRACVAAVEDASMNETFHHCTAEIAEPCGASATAKAASECILNERDAVEAEIARAAAALAERRGEAVEEVTSALDGNRSAGEASCAMMASQDKTARVKVGQRAVNGAFCDLIVSGDVLGMLYRMEAAE